MSSSVTVNVTSPVNYITKSTLRDKKNWYIHMLYTRKDFIECLRVIEDQLKACGGQSEYPLYIKGKENK